MATTIITFERLQGIMKNDNEIISYNGMVILFDWDTKIFSIYKESQGEESDPDPIFESNSITDTYNYLNS